MITWADKSWTNQDLTVRHLALIAEGRLRDDWDFDPRSGPLRLLYVLAALIAVDSDARLGDVLAALLDLPAVNLVGALDAN